MIAIQHFCKSSKSQNVFHVLFGVAGNHYSTVGDCFVGVRWAVARANARRASTDWNNSQILLPRHCSYSLRQIPLGIEVISLGQITVHCKPVRLISRLAYRFAVLFNFFINNVIIISYTMHLCNVTYNLI